VIGNWLAGLLGIGYSGLLASIGRGRRRRGRCCCSFSASSTSPGVAYGSGGGINRRRSSPCRLGSESSSACGDARLLFGWIVAAITIADHLPKHPAIDLIYFLVVGTAWGLPLFPLMKWMNR
jgi:hypothetical protein